MERHGIHIQQLPWICCVCCSVCAVLSMLLRECKHIPHWVIQPSLQLVVRATQRLQCGEDPSSGEQDRVVHGGEDGEIWTIESESEHTHTQLQQHINVSGCRLLRSAELLTVALECEIDEIIGIDGASKCRSVYTASCEYAACAAPCRCCVACVSSQWSRQEIA